jgi:Gas vesicle synthesis protein GvpL/GvpF
MNDFVWVYAVTNRADRDGLRYVPGVGGVQVRDVSEAGLHAVVSSMGPGAFGGAPLTSVLADPDSMYRVGTEHHEVIAAVARDSPVVPMRLATVYPDDETVRALLAEHWDELTDLLRAFSGTQEWAVQVYLDGPGLAGHGPAGAEMSPLAGRGPGAAALPGRESAWQQAEAHADQIDRRLSLLSIESRRHPLPCLRFRTEGWMVLNGAYLVREENADEFGEAARNPGGLAEGVRTAITGPWPPYSFVDREEARASLGLPRRVS